MFNFNFFDTKPRTELARKLRKKGDAEKFKRKYHFKDIVMDADGKLRTTNNNSAIKQRRTYEDVWFSRSPKEHGVNRSREPLEDARQTNPDSDEMSVRSSRSWQSWRRIWSKVREDPIDTSDSESCPKDRIAREAERLIQRALSSPTLRTARAQSPMLVTEVQRVKSMKAEVLSCPPGRKPERKQSKRDVQTKN